jgi:type II secretory pathway component PulL
LTGSDLDEGSSEQSAGTSGGQEANDLDGTARWRESFIEHAGSQTSNRRVIWLVVGLVLVILLTFILAA